MGNFMAKWEHGKMGIWRNGLKTPHHDHKILNVMLRDHYLKGGLKQKVVWRNGNMA
jgi:hypothetical protein